MDDLLKLEKKNIIMLFNEELSIFLTELQRIFSEINECSTSASKISTYKKTIKSAIKVNTTIGISMFSAYIFDDANKNFSEKISAGDYDYFLELSSTLDNTNAFYDIITIIKSLFIKLSEESKTNIFGFLKNLTLLANVFVLKT